ncbi:MAG TPA: hypothetical protein DIU15_17485 [Deltaproteobacteria bacterium]|nr:hypothetical protein [Deltaproteobacteria bacterium]
MLSEFGFPFGASSLTIGDPGEMGAVQVHFTDNPNLCSYTTTPDWIAANCSGRCVQGDLEGNNDSC